jgi:hypothetical protein
MAYDSTTDGDISRFDEDGYPKGIASVIQSSKNSKLDQTRIWDLSLMYLNGQQNVRYDKSLQQYVTLRNQPGRNQLIINLILNMYRAICSRLATNYPSISVLPASPSNDDIIKAKSSEEAIKYFYHRENVKRDLEKAIEWLVSCGNTGLMEYYDPDKKEIKLKVISPYDIFFEAGINNVEESGFVAIRSVVRRQDLIKAFPNKEEEIMKAATLSTENAVEDNTYPHTQSYEGESFFYPRVELFEIFFADGKYAYVVGNEYIYKGENPIEKIPFQFIRYTNLPDKVWGKGMVEGIIDLQNLYNRSRNQLLQNVELMSNPKWLIPKTAGVNGAAIRGTPGEIIYYNAAGGVPAQVAGTPIPAYVFDHMTRLQQEMLDVSGIHSTTLGRRAVGITSGKAINALADQDVTQLVMTQDNIEVAVKGMAECVLLLMKKFYTEDRFIRMLDGMGAMIFKKLNATDVVDIPEIFLEAGTMFRDDTADRDQKVLQLLQLGLIPPNIALQELSFKTGNAYVLQEISYLNHAQEMLDGVKAGAEIEIFASDDLKSFKKVFGDYIKSDEYYLLPEEIRDYIRDIVISIDTYQPPSPDDPAENKVKYKVFPHAVAPNDQEKFIKEMLVSSGPAQGQMLQQQLENAMTANAYGQVKQQVKPQTNDAAIVNKRGAM